MAVGKNINPWLAAVFISLAPFMEVLDTTIVNVALRHMAGSLGAGEDESTWVLTAYLLANGIVMPLSGWLAGVLGRKTYFLASMVMFTVASFLCGAATSLAMLILFRLIQGLAGGGLQPVQQSIMLDLFPPEKRGQAFALTGITMVVAPILGPTLGGLITDHFDWRWVFWVNVPIGILAFFLVNWVVEDPAHAKAQGFGKLDGIGLGLVALGLGSLQVFLDKGQQLDWLAAPFIRLMGGMALVCLVGALVWLWRRKDPIIDVQLLKIPSYGLACLMMFIIGFSLYGGAVLVPLMVQTQFGYTATLAGLVLSPGALGLIFLMPVVGKLVNKLPARNLIAVGLLLLAAGMAYSAYVAPAMTYTQLVGLRLGQVLGLPFLFIPISTMAFHEIPPEKNNKASAFFALTRNLGGSVGIALAMTYLARRTQVHQAYLVEHLRSGNPFYDAALAAKASALHVVGLGDGAAQSGAMGLLYRELVRQASLLAYADAYLFIALLALATLLLVPFLPKFAGGKPGMGH